MSEHDPLRVVFSATNLQPVAIADQRDLFLATLEIHRNSLARPQPRLPKLEQIYNTVHTITMSERLPLAEIMLLGEATDFREEGLQLARAGENADGARLIAESRLRFEQAGLSQEALLLAESFQEAAEAYVQYKANHHIEAKTLLLDAIRCCCVLHNDYDYPVEIRRIHLARNIVRVTMLAGEPVEALGLADRLIRYIEDDANAWPWPSLVVTEPDGLGLDARLFLMDQVLSDVALMLTTTSPRGRDLLHTADERGWLSVVEGPNHLKRPRTWIAARRMAVQGNWQEFLRFGGEFFAEPPGRLGTAWRELTRDLAVLGMVLAPEETVKLLMD